MRRKGEQGRQEAQQQRDAESTEEFDLWTEASTDLEENPHDAPDYVPKGQPEVKGKGKGRGRGIKGSSSSPSSSRGG